MSTNILSIEIGPSALIFSTAEQRKEIYDLWLQARGIRVWADRDARGTKLFFQMGDGAKGHIKPTGEVIWA